MKTIAIYTRTIDKKGYPFNEEYYVEAYTDLLLAIKNEGANAYFVSGMDTYLGNGNFSEAFTVDAKVAFEQFTKTGPIHADVVFEKGDFNATDTCVLNPIKVARITENKAETTKLFGKFQVPTIVCENEQKLDNAFASIVGDKIVVKKPVSHSGTDVTIGLKSEVRALVGSDYPYIVQEFMDTSAGIPGIAKGMHDFRIYMLGGTPIACSVREPKAGEYRANTGQGGTETHFEATRIPDELLAMMREIDRQFARYNRYYSIDFARTQQGWRLIELNSKPGLDPVKNSPIISHITNSLARYLVAIS